MAKKDDVDFEKARREADKQGRKAYEEARGLRCSCGSNLKLDKRGRWYCPRCR